MDNQTVLEKRIAEQVAVLTYQHLTRSNLVREDPVDEPLIYVWPQPDRVVLIVNPLRVKNLEALVKPRFQHHLATVLQGRRVVVTNHRGIFVQVGYYPEAHRELVSRPLDLSAQRTPLHVPIGVTANGDLWLSLVDLDAVLIGGSRRMGKTNLLHGWIAALLQGKDARLVLFDGKGGVEFARYANQPRCRVITEALGPVLGELYGEMNRRFDLLKAAGAASLAEYNHFQGEGAQFERIALIVDELAYALQEPGVEDVLVDLAARGGGGRHSSPPGDPAPFERRGHAATQGQPGDAHRLAGPGPRVVDGGAGSLGRRDADQDAGAVAHRAQCAPGRGAGVSGSIRRGRGGGDSSAGAPADDGAGAETGRGRARAGGLVQGERDRARDRAAAGIRRRRGAAVGAAGVADRGGAERAGAQAGTAGDRGAGSRIRR